LVAQVATRHNPPDDPTLSAAPAGGVVDQRYSLEELFDRMMGTGCTMPA
jgi:hypothetical protein